MHDGKEKRRKKKERTQERKKERKKIKKERKREKKNNKIKILCLFFSTFVSASRTLGAFFYNRIANTSVSFCCGYHKVALIP